MKLNKQLLCALLLFPLVSLAQNTSEITIHFAKDSHHIDAMMQDLLSEFVQTLNPNNVRSVHISGHTDDDGSQRYNQRLSQRRTEVVQDNLIALGLDKRTMVLGSFGERMPVVANVTEEDQQANRRVNVLVQFYDYRDLDSFHRSLEEMPVTEQTINPQKKNTVRGKGGVEVNIPANAFCNADGQAVEESVTFTLEEALGNEQFVREGLSMSSGERILETGGMIRIQARSEDGTPLQIQKGQSLQLSIPSPSVKPGMLTFVSEDGADWQEEEKSTFIISLPLRPSITYRGVKVPRFEFKRDMDSKPRRPFDPVYPRMPKEPDPLSFVPTIKWHQFLKKAEIEERSEQRYRYAVQNYQKKLEKYERKVDLYNLNCQDMANRSSAYYRELEKWNTKQVQDSTEKRQTWRTENAAAIAVNDSLRLEASARINARWKAQRDSIVAINSERLASMQGANSWATQYVLSTSSLGWINCDRFVEAEERYFVELDSPFKRKGNMILVYDDIRSMIMLNKDKKNNRFHYSGLPLGRKARLVAYEIRKGSLFMSQTTIDGPVEEIEELKSANIRDFLQAIECQDIQASNR